MGALNKFLQTADKLAVLMANIDISVVRGRIELEVLPLGTRTIYVANRYNTQSLSSHGRWMVVE